MSDLPVVKDPATTAIETSIEQAAETARHYIDQLLSPGLEQGGGMIADTIGYWRFKNKINLVLKAKAFLESKGIRPRAVLPKVVIPILDAGSLETDEVMLTRWSWLLAHSAMDPDSVSPSFPRMLADLAPTDALILDWLYSVMAFPPERTFGNKDPTTMSVQAVMDATGKSLEHTLLALANLERHGLVQSSNPIAIMQFQQTEPWFIHLLLTAFGSAFVNACRAG